MVSNEVCPPFCLAPLPAKKASPASGEGPAPLSLPVPRKAALGGAGEGENAASSMMAASDPRGVRGPAPMPSWPISCFRPLPVISSACWPSLPPPRDREVTVPSLDRRPPCSLRHASQCTGRPSRSSRDAQCTGYMCCRRVPGPRHQIIPSFIHDHAHLSASNF